MITIREVELMRGIKILFSHANTSFYDKQKVGVVGKNGSGKTSLFLLLQNLLEPSAGTISFAKALKIVTVEQEIPHGTKSAVEYVIDADIALRKCQMKLQIAEKDCDGLKIAELYEELQNLNGFTAETRAAKILAGLGFSEHKMHTSVDTLSGGWRMRLNIAQALFAPSDVLLLDEPTNHLDLDAVIWLEKWLQQYSGLLLFISHDREFLDKIATNIIHIENKQLKNYSGNYSNFEEQRAIALAQQQQQYEKQHQQIEHIQTFINRFKAKATKAKQAQSRIKALARMEKIMQAHIDSPFSFEFKKPKCLANPLLTLHNVKFAYKNNEWILDNINFQLNVQERIALLGKNGAGKSTFIKLLARDLTPTVGNIDSNKKLKIGYFAQHTLNKLDGDKNSLQNLQKIAPNSPQSELRKFLGGFNFCGDLALMKAKNLSGGEKARLALALIVWETPDVLLLDEPTNHLDLDMRQALVIALQNYEGAVVLVSHDRFLLKNVVDDFWLVADQKVKRFSEGLDAYKNYVLLNNDPIIRKHPRKKHDHNKRKLLIDLENKINKLQKEISELDHKIAELSINPIDSLKEIQNLSAKRSDLVMQCEIKEDKWLSLQNE